MTEPTISLAFPASTVRVAPGQYVRIDFNLADGQVALATLPDLTSHDVVRAGAEVRWTGPHTLVYRAPPAGRDKFEVRGRNIHGHIGLHVQAVHVVPGTVVPDQANLKAEFDAAMPTVRMGGRGIGGGTVDPRVAVLEAKIAAAAKVLRE